MSDHALSRRAFLAAGIAFGGRALLDVPVMAQATTLVRRNIRDLSPNGPEITRLREAFRIIEGRPGTSRTSWLFQANIHRNSCAHANWWFLPWHRGYLYYFEQILRAAVGDPSLTLPYWDWSDSSTRAIPSPYWTQYLYRVVRGAGIGPASLVPDEFVDPEAIIEPILGIADFQTFGGSPSSSPLTRVAGGWLEGSPHNNIHNWIGGAMARPEWAAQDPVFWMHHANVDRLWVEWSRRHPNALPTSATWRNQPFTFYDPQGVARSIAPRQMLTTEALNYRYDDHPTPLLAQKPATPSPAPAAQRPERPSGLSVASAAASPVLGPAPVTLTLKPPPAFHQALRRFAAPAGGDTQPAEGVRLAIEDIQVPDMPQVLVRVFLNKPDADARTPIRDPHYAGNFSFFTSRDHTHDGQAVSSPITQYLDVTRTIRRLTEARLYKPGDDLQLTLLAVPITPQRQPQAAIRIPFRRVSLSVPGT